MQIVTDYAGTQSLVSAYKKRKIQTILIIDQIL